MHGCHNFYILNHRCTAASIFIEGHMRPYDSRLCTPNVKAIEARAKWHSSKAGYVEFLVNDKLEKERSYMQPLEHNRVEVSAKTDLWSAGS